MAGVAAFVSFAFFGALCLLAAAPSFTHAETLQEQVTRLNTSLETSRASVKSFATKLTSTSGGFHFSFALGEGMFVNVTVPASESSSSTALIAVGIGAGAGGLLLGVLLLAFCLKKSSHNKLAAAQPSNLISPHSSFNPLYRSSFSDRPQNNYMTEEPDNETTMRTRTQTPVFAANPSPRPLSTFAQPVSPPTVPLQPVLEEPLPPVSSPTNTIDRMTVKGLSSRESSDAPKLVLDEHHTRISQPRDRTESTLSGFGFGEFDSDSASHLDRTSSLAAPRLVIVDSSKFESINENAEKKNSSQSSRPVSMNSANLHSGPRDGGYMETENESDEAEAKRHGPSIPPSEPAVVPPPQNLPKGIALFEFNGHGESQLELYEGEVFEVLDHSLPWWHVRNLRGEEGIVPSNFVKLLETESQKHADEEDEDEKHEKEKELLRVRIEEEEREQRARVAELEARAQQEKEAHDRKIREAEEHRVLMEKKLAEQSEREQREEEERQAKIRQVKAEREFELSRQASITRRALSASEKDNIEKDRREKIRQERADRESQYARLTMCAIAEEEEEEEVEEEEQNIVEEEAENDHGADGTYDRGRHQKHDAHDPDEPEGFGTTTPPKRDSLSKGRGVWEDDEEDQLKEEQVKPVSMGYSEIKRDLKTKTPSVKKTATYGTTSARRPEKFGIDLREKGIVAETNSLDDEFEIDDDYWELERKDLDLVDLLGEGQYGEVWGGLLKGSGEHEGMLAQVAVKMVKDASKNDEFLKEARVMMILQHSNLLNLYGVVCRTEPVLIVTARMENGSLVSYLREERPRPLPMSQLLNMSLDIARGMEYIASSGFVHRDLATRNVLLNDSLKCKIADFGFTQFVGDKFLELAETTLFPVRHTAPEVITFYRFYQASDTWSYGVTVYEIFTKAALPYDGWSNQQVIDEIRGGFRLSKPKTCPVELFDIVLDCWKDNHTERPLFGEIVNRISEI